MKSLCIETGEALRNSIKQIKMKKQSIQWWYRMLSTVFKERKMEICVLSVPVHACVFFMHKVFLEMCAKHGVSCHCWIHPSWVAAGKLWESFPILHFVPLGFQKLWMHFIQQISAGWMNCFSETWEVTYEKILNQHF